MQIKSRVVASSVIGCLAVAGVAVAKPPTKPPHTGGSNKSGATSNKCGTHEVAYVASGLVVSWGASAGANGLFSGPVSVMVSKANHHAGNAKGTTVPLMLNNTTLKLGRGVTQPVVANDRIKVIGKITAVAKKCTNQTGAGVVTVRTVRVTAPSTP